MRINLKSFMCIHRYRYISNHSYVVHIQNHKGTRMTLQYRYSIDLFRDRDHRWGHTHLYSHNHRYLRSSLSRGRQFLSLFLVIVIFVDPWLITIDASTFIRANRIFTLTRNWARICHAFIHISTSITILSITQLRKIYLYFFHKLCQKCHFLTLQTHLKLPSVLTHSSLNSSHVTISCLHSSTSMHIRVLVSSSSSSTLLKFSNSFKSEKHTFFHSPQYKRIHMIQLYFRILFQISTLTWIQRYSGLKNVSLKQFEIMLKRETGPCKVPIQKHIRRHPNISPDRRKNPNRKCMRNFQSYFDM